MKEDRILKSIIKKLEENINEIRMLEQLNDYNEGVIDGLIIAIRTIEG